MLTSPRAILLLLLCAAACRSAPADDVPPPLEPVGGAGGAPVEPCRTDDDGDGVRAERCGGLDCDDEDPVVHGGALERCGDRVDQDCDGEVDEGCECDPGDRRGCWEGEPDVRGVGACRDGVQVCALDGRYGPCTGSRLPAAEQGCDGVDDDCDGSDGSEERPCPSCPPDAREICGNGLDDDCDGERDDPGLCRFTCRGVEPRVQPEAACCIAPEQLRHAFTCVDAPALPACGSPARLCLDLDGDPTTLCVRRCTEEGCVCGASQAGSPPAPSPACGFETPCARLDCDDRQGQPCYSGPPSTLGRGVCRGGHATCASGPDGARAWGACEGEVLPGVEVCDNDLDDDCDGRVDEDDGATGRACPPASRTCLAADVCGNGEDDDCDGYPEDGCPLPPLEEAACFSGPPAARRVGACQDGVQRSAAGLAGVCLGEVLPQPELCGDGVDSDCDGHGGPGQPEDEGCCTAAGLELCNGVDDDCDGLADEGLLSHCGRCDGSACFGVRWDAAGCDQGVTTCERIGVAEGGGFTVDPDAVVEASPDLLLPLNGDLLRVNADTGERVRSLVHLIPSSFGAAWSLDGTMWSVEGEMLYHRDMEGRTLCKREVRAPQALVVDPRGDPWVLSRAGTLLKFDARNVEELQLDGTPWPDFGVRCAIVDLTPEDGDARSVSIWLGRPYDDVQLGGFGLVWLISGTDTQRLDPATGERITVHTATPWAVSGIADLEGNLWIGGPELTRIKAQGPYDDPNVYQTRYQVHLDRPLLASDGALWGTTGDALVRFDPRTGFVSEWLPPTTEPLRFFTIDEKDRIFAASILEPLPTGAYWRFEGESWKKFFTDKDYLPAPFFSPSGLTPAHLRRLAKGRGTWTRVVDGQTVRAIFHRVTWTEEVPPGASVEVVVRLARESRQLDRTTFICGPGQGGELDLLACSGGVPSRFARVEVVLDAAPDGSLPIVRDLSVEWSR